MLFDLPPDPPKLWLPPKPAIIRAATPELLQPMNRHRRRAGTTAAAAVQEYIGEFTGDKAGTNSATVTIPITYGAADDNRLVVVGGSMAFQTSGGSVTASSPTIGGVSASFIPQASVLGAARGFHILAWATVPTGTSGNFVCTLTAPKLQEEYAFRVWRAVGLSSNTEHDTSTSYPGTIDVPDDGFLVASYDSNSARSFSSGVTRDGTEVTLTTQVIISGGGSATFLAAEIGRTIAFVSGTAALAAVSFG